jgi:hypothetical protein
MGLVVKDGGEFRPHPQGQFRAICMDVVDLGMVENKRFGKVQHKIAVVFHSDEKMDDGKPFEIWERFTATLSDQGHLRPFLESWRGRAFTPEELKGFDLEKLIGVNAVIQVIQTQKDGKTYGNVRGIMLPMRGVEKLDPTPDYIRRKDREPVGTAAGATSGSVAAGPGLESPEDLPENWGGDDDDLPF